MAKQDQYPRDDDGRTKEQIPHSFRHGETPVNEFDNTPLTDAVEQGLIITPDSPALLMPDKKSWFTDNKNKVIVGLAGLSLAATAALGVSLAKGDGVSAEPKQPSVGAPIVPSEAPSDPVQSSPVETTPSPSPETNIPVTDAYVESVNRDPSDEVIAYSLVPVEVGQFTEREAMMRLLNDWKVYWISGKTSQSSDISQTQTPESLALEVKQLDNIFGDENVRDESNLLWDWMTGTREYLTLNMGYLIPENGYPENGTFNSNFEILSIENVDGTKIEALVRNDWTSNMNTLDPRTATQDVDATSFSTDRYITIEPLDGVYHITKIQSRAVVD